MVAEVIINTSVKDLNKIFDYNIPLHLESQVKLGSRVYVPFGNKKAPEEGFVVNIKQKSAYKIKDIINIEEKNYLNDDKIELAKWMANTCFCNVSDCIKLMLPPGTASKNESARIKEKNLNFVHIIITKEQLEQDIESKKIKSEKQIKILNFLLENGDTHTTDLATLTDTSTAIIKTLCKNEYVEIVEKQVERDPFQNKSIQKTNNLKLTEEQESAYQAVADSIDDYMNSEFLLYGVTGSGKTEVYLQLIQKVLEMGKSSIVLVPEISLTPQTVDRFISRFGQDIVAVLHSKLSVGERFDQWQKIKNGQAKIIIGARSAIFAPVEDLGIIIIDEEHDNSYKSEMNPRYNAKEVARYLAKKANIPVVFGSATPDMHTYYKAQNGDIELLELTKRANNSNLAQIEIVDLRQELINGNRSMISTKLHTAIEENLKNKRQTILFLNRRGFSTFIMCRDCGYTAKCKHCNITLTYHSKPERLKCHYCGYESNVIKECPECKSKNIRYFGTGTQKLETEINKLFPQASTIRMDVDTVSKKNSHEDILNKFKNENVDILIGTQMVVKGHHFPNVTLVGVIAADGSMNIEDFRASERTFQILTQVAGRAGRENLPGKVIIQTYNPDSYAIEFAEKQDYKLFYNTEITLRKQLKYPPFCDIILIGFSSENEQKIKLVSTKIHQYLKNKIQQDNIPIILYKPVPSPIDKIKNKFRWRMIIKCKFGNDIVKTLNECMSENQTRNSDVRITMDVNPTNMM